jgi:repressor LexA
VTPRQREALRFVASWIQAHGFAPSLLEISEGLGLHSVAIAHRHVSRLERKGFLFHDPGVARSLRVLDLERL